MRRLRDPLTTQLRLLKKDLKALYNPHFRGVVKEGSSAAWDGRRLEDNPYPKNSDCWEWWVQGFERAEREIRRLPRL